MDCNCFLIVAIIPTTIFFHKLHVLIPIFLFFGQHKIVLIDMALLGSVGVEREHLLLLLLHLEILLYCRGWHRDFQDRYLPFI